LGSSSLPRKGGKEVGLSVPSPSTLKNLPYFRLSTSIPCRDFFYLISLLQKIEQQKKIRVMNKGKK